MSPLLDSQKALNATAAAHIPTLRDNEILSSWVGTGRPKDAAIFGFRRTNTLCFGCLSIERAV